MSRNKLSSQLKSEPFTLALSSSFFGFYAHAGIIQALREAQITPKKIIGSSAGAIIGGAWASDLKTSEIKDLLFSLRKNDFWDPGFGFGLLRGKKFLSLLQKNFAASFSETKIPFSTVVFDLFSCQTDFLEKGSLPNAIAASCAVPLMFHPVKIAGRYYLDGGLFHKSALPISDENAICIYLQNDGLTGAYETKSDLKNISPMHRVLKFSALPKVGPRRLENGRVAYEEAYLRMKLGLELPNTEKMIHL